MDTNRGLLSLVRRAHRQIANLVEEATSLTESQCVVLLALSSGESATQTELCRRTGIDRSTLSEVVMRMCRDGLLLRERSSSDLRAYAVRLSRQGIKTRAAVAKKVSVIEQSIMDRVPGYLPFDRALAQL